jgi:hypothetical protein
MKTNTGIKSLQQPKNGLQKMCFLCLEGLDILSGGLETFKSKIFGHKKTGSGSMLTKKPETVFD